MPNIKQLQIGSDTYDIKAKYAAEHSLDNFIVRDIKCGTIAPVSTDGEDGQLYLQCDYDITDNNYIYADDTIVDGDSVIDNYYSKNEMDNIIEQLFNRIYPVGSIYMSVNSTNPGTLFGGTWTQLQNRFLLGAGSSYTNGATGGSATVTLTTNQIPSHQHELQIQTGSTWYKAQVYTIFSGGNGRSSFNWNEGSANSNSRISPTGGGQAHENMPPYLVVYMWKRTA